MAANNSVQATFSLPSQTWRAFLDNHVGNSVSIDFFTVSTVTFWVLFVFVVLAHDRRRVAHFNVTDSPSAKWTAQQIKDSPEPRSVEPPDQGRIAEFPMVGGLHHRYSRLAA